MRLYLISFYILIFGACKQNAEKISDQTIGTTSSVYDTANWKSQINGKNIFAQQCTSCHNSPDREAKDANTFDHIFDRYPDPKEKYFTKFIQDSKSLKHGGDSFALALDRANNSDYEHHFANVLTGTDIQDLIEFIKASETKRRFFDYDKIDYYYNNFDENYLSALYENEHKSRIDSLKKSVLVDYMKGDLRNQKFLNKLESIGYVKKQIDTSKYKSIDEIFTEQYVSFWSGAPCIAVYRDILVFKKYEKITGIAKVCFGCGAIDILGTPANTENFGQNGDYDTLLEILREDGVNQ